MYNLDVSYQTAHTSIQVIKIFLELLFTSRSWDTRVGMAMSYWLESKDSIPAVQGFSLLYSIQIDSGVHLTYPKGTGGSIPVVKEHGCEADHPPPSNAEVKNGGATSPLPSMSSWHNA
jgi:hypothetical protein